MISVYFKNKNEKVELEKGSSARDLAEKFQLTGPEQSLAAEINDKIVDLNSPLQNGDTVFLISFDSKEGHEIFWHSTAHVLAQAVLRLWPDAKPTIGPPIENGFYYDFANLTISDADFKKLEKEMQKVISENHKPIREEFDGQEEAVQAFQDNPYKVELIKEFDPEGTFSAYRQGEFFDLCRGPHLPNLGKIKAVKVMKTSGAYWRGDSDREMLTRIYGISFPDRKELKAYLTLLEEAKKRDHRLLGAKLDLFSLREEAPGLPFFHPKGMVVWNRLLAFWREMHQDDYLEIKTPLMMTRELWETSGHWANYRENMFTTNIEKRDFAIKPMNCPGCILYYKSTTHSYRELPLRIGEIGHVHRYEPSGALSGLFRVRSFHQDDAHIFMKPEDIAPEILKVLELTDKLYSPFGLEYNFELSTRPDSKTIGTDEDWKFSTNALREALEKYGRGYKVNEGDGAFYGPKIDIKIKDAIGRTWQCGTIQLDMALPERFEIEYVSDEGTRKRPVMIHRALFGSFERFLGILIEHFSGRFPLWLNPSQVRLIPVADRHADYANEVAAKIRRAGFEVDVDAHQVSVSKKIREAQLMQFNYMLTIGDKELEMQNLNLRTRTNERVGEITLDNFLEMIIQERDKKSLNSPFKAVQSGA